MLENLNNDDDDDTKQQSLPLSLHPDDAKDKVFTAILKALLDMDNKPSSPKELANVIIQSNYATLGGLTPFATVSSRISQHFKRAAQHNPPRSPLLTRHVDSSHSRKINYSLSTESILPSPTPSAPASPPSLSQKVRPQQKSKRKVVQALSLEHDDAQHTQPTGQTKTKRQRIQNYTYDDKSIAISTRSKQKSKSITTMPSASAPSFSTNLAIPSVSTAAKVTNSTDDDVKNPVEDSSDYYQDMLNETLDHLDETSETIKEPPLAVSQQQSDTNNNSSLDYQHIDDTNSLWTNNIAMDDDFGLVHLPDSSTAHHMSFKIDAPETVPLSELDDYFGNDKESPTVAKYGHTLSTDTTHTHLHKESSLSICPLKDTHLGTKDNNTPINDQRDLAQHTHKHQRRYSWSQNPNNVYSSDYHMIIDSTQSTSSSTTTCTEGKGDDDIFFNFEGDIDDKSNAPEHFIPTQPVKNTESVATSLTIPTLTKLLELMHDHQTNFTTLRQIIATTPELKYLLPIVGQIQSLAAYLQNLTTSYTDASTSSSQSTIDSNSSTTQQNSDINAILTQFPMLRLLLDKYHTQQNGSATQQQQQQQQSSPETITVQTTTTTNPIMYITVVDDIAVCVAILPATCDHPEYRMMRLLDLDYVNGTTLLKAGGIDTERERSIIFSLEKDRLRIRRQNSVLNGTWLPLKRAQHLAATCSIEHRLGSFLDNSIESHFPSPLPVNVNKRQQINPTSSPKDPLLYSWKMDDDGLEISHSVLSRNVSFAGDSNAGGHCTDAFWCDTVASKSSLLGRRSVSASGSDIYLGTGLNNLQRHLSAAPSPTSSSSSSSTSTTTVPSKGKMTYWDTTTNDDLSDHSDDATDTDSDTEELRRQMKRNYDAAVNSISEDSSLDDLLHQQYGPTQSENMPTQIKRRRKQQHTLRSSNTTTKQKAPTHRRKSTTNKRQNASEPAMIMKSASWHGSINLPRPPFSVTSTLPQPCQEIVTNSTPVFFAMDGSSNMLTPGEDDELSEVDIGGNGYGDDLR